jgi:hypothetical protein
MVRCSSPPKEFFLLRDSGLGEGDFLSLPEEWIVSAFRILRSPVERRILLKIRLSKEFELENSYEPDKRMQFY